MSDEKPKTRLPAIGPWAIVAHSIWSDPKIIKSGPMGALVYIRLLTGNAFHGRTGFVPASECEAWYIARELGISEQDANDALSRLVTNGALEEDAEAWRLTGWSDKWRRAAETEVEREKKARFRAKAKAASKISTAADLRKNEIPDQDREEEREREESEDMSRTCPGQPVSLCLSPLESRLEEISQKRGHGAITWSQENKSALQKLQGQHSDEEIVRRWDNLLCRPEGFPQTRTVGVFVNPNVFDGCAKRVVDPIQRVRDLEEEERANPQTPERPKWKPGPNHVRLACDQIPDVYAVLSDVADDSASRRTVDHFERVCDGQASRIEPTFSSIGGHIESVELGSAILTAVFRLPSGAFVLVAHERDGDELEALVYGERKPAQSVGDKPTLEEQRRFIADAKKACR